MANGLECRVCLAKKNTALCGSIDSDTTVFSVKEAGESALCCWYKIYVRMVWLQYLCQVIRRDLDIPHFGPTPTKQYIQTHDYNSLCGTSTGAKDTALPNLLAWCDRIAEAEKKQKATQRVTGKQLRIAVSTVENFGT